MFLDDEYEKLIVHTFLNALKSAYMGYELEFLYVKEVCKKFKLEITEIWGILSKMLNALNTELIRKADV